jgi:hypothetical protein
MIHNTYIKPVALYGSESWPLKNSNEMLLGRFERKFLRKIIGPVMEEKFIRLRDNDELNDIFKDTTNCQRSEN